jgi:hypothetical protein
MLRHTTTTQAGCRVLIHGGASRAECNDIRAGSRRRCDSEPSALDARILFGAPVVHRLLLGAVQPARSTQAFLPDSEWVFDPS